MASPATSAWNSWNATSTPFRQSPGTGAGGNKGLEFAAIGAQLVYVKDSLPVLNGQRLRSSLSTGMASANRSPIGTPKRALTADGCRPVGSTCGTQRRGAGPHSLPHRLEHRAAPDSSSKTLPACGCKDRQPGVQRLQWAPQHSSWHE
jgi:hypothetical protein